jgi:Insertion element 4 transposase N-terminal
MVTVSRPVTAAAGVLAPGHLGELTCYLPFELVDDVLEATRAVQRRIRVLPSRVGVYFVVAMTMFPGLGYLRVWDKLTAALAGAGGDPAFGEGAARPAPPGRRGPGEGLVRGRGGPARAAADPGGDLPRAADGRFRRPELGQGAR